MKITTSSKNKLGAISNNTMRLLAGTFGGATVASFLITNVAIPFASNTQIGDLYRIKHTVDSMVTNDTIRAEFGKRDVFFQKHLNRETQQPYYVYTSSPTPAERSITNLVEHPSAGTNSISFSN